jgi:hypothetical protein
MLGRIFSLGVLAFVLAAPVAQAAPKAKGKAPAAAKAKKGAEKEKEASESTAAEDAKASVKEESVKTAGTATPKTTDAGVVKTKEDKEGVKTYRFDTIEVEGRLKSPQVIYFLRRVRAEFEAGALGHRSFLGELSDSRRSAAFR